MNRTILSKSQICVLFAIAAFGWPDPATAQTSYPFIYSLYPCGLKRGATEEIALSGEHNFNGAYKVLIEGTGVTGEVIVPKDGWPPLDEKKKTLPVLNQIKLKITAVPDAGLGVREVRVITPRGVSSVGMIVIGDEPEVQEKEPNNEPAQAQEINPPVTINGRLQQGEDIDTFKFKAQAGEELTFSVTCARLEDKIHDLQEHADPIITLRDSTGRELASNDDYYRADPLLHYRFEQSGEYMIQIRDVRYLGNQYWTYRLSVTKRPYITSLIPMGVHTGATSGIAAIGYNLGEPKLASLEVPAGVPMGERTVQLKTANGISNPVPVLVTDLPLKSLQNGPAPGQVENLDIPGAVNARIAGDKMGLKHRYRFHAEKGRMYTFEVEARRFDSRIDSVLTLFNPEGKEIASNDDAGSADSLLNFTAPANGDYQIEVRDLHQRGGDNFVYLLTARPSGPDFTLRCDDDKMKLGPGNSGAWYVHVNRLFGFNGEIKVEVKGLPAGVTATPLTIPANMNQGCVILTCAPNAKIGVGTVEVIGTATANGPDGKPATLVHRAIPESEIYLPGGGRGLFKVEMQVVAVTDPSDIVIELSATSVTLAPGGTAKIDVNVKRAPGYTKPVTLDVLLRHLGSVYGNPFPPGVSLDEGASKTLLGDNETKGSIVLKADQSAAPVANLPIAVLGAVSINFVVKVSYAGPPVLLTVTPKK